MIKLGGITVYETLPAHCVDLHDACICTLDSCIEDDEMNLPNAVDDVTKAGVIYVGDKAVHWGLVDERHARAFSCDLPDTVIVDAPGVTGEIITALQAANIIHAE